MNPPIPRVLAALVCAAGLTAAQDMTTDLVIVDRPIELVGGYFDDPSDGPSTFTLEIRDGDPQDPEPGDGEDKKQSIGFENSCPDDGDEPSGDVDGDGEEDDTEIDINGSEEEGNALCFPNGKLCLWCVGDSYYVLIWKPSGSGDSGGKLVGKCPYGGGQNRGSVCIDPETGELTGTEWNSTDGGKDDDGDGQKDEYNYKFDAATCKLTQTNIEDGVPEDDPTTGDAPDAGKFDFTTLEPADNTQDGGPVFEATPMTVTMSRLPNGQTAQLTVESTIHNAGGFDVVANHSTFFQVPFGCTVDGGQATSRQGQYVVPAGDFISVKNTYDVAGTIAEDYVFDILSFVSPADPTILDVDPTNDTTVLPFAVEISDDAWFDIGGGGLPGESYPELVGTGSMQAGTPWAVDLTGGAPSSPSIWYVSFTSRPILFNGSLLKAFPPVQTVNVQTNAAGAARIGGPAAPPVPVGFEYYVQAGVVDANASAGVSLTNAVQATVP